MVRSGYIDDDTTQPTANRHEPFSDHKHKYFLEPKQDALNFKHKMHKKEN
jgi:hypothetical protein